MTSHFQTQLIKALEHGTLRQQLMVRLTVSVELANSIPIIVDELEARQYYNEHKN